MIDPPAELEPQPAAASPLYEALVALRESEARFRSLAELSSDWYWEQDEHFRFTSRSGGSAEHAALRPLEDDGKTRWELPVFGVSEAQWCEHRALLKAHRPFRDFVYQRRDAAGHIRHVSVSGHPVFDAQGVFKGYRGIARDVTAARRDEQLLALEHAIARGLAVAENARTALVEVLRTICLAENWEHGSYWRADEAAAVMRFGQAWHVPGDDLQRYTESSREVVFPPGVGLVGIAWQTGEPVWVADFGADPRVLQKTLARDISLRGMFVFPVMADGRAIGMLTFFSRQVSKPDDRLLAAARVIGSQVGQFLRRKEREEALRESEARFRSLCELSSDWYWEQDEEFRFTLMSGGVMNKGNFVVQKALGKRRWELPVEAHGTDWEAHKALLRAHQPFTDFEYRLRTEDGALRHYSVSGEPLFDEEGGFRGYRGVANDITPRKQRDEELRRFRAAMDTSADAIVLIERAGMRFVDVNDTACAMLGYSREQLLSMGPHDVFSQMLEGLERDYDALIGGGPAGQRWQTMGRCADGSRLPLEVSHRAIPSDGGWIIVGIARDIRERLAAEQTIRHRAMQQELIAEFGRKALGDMSLEGLLYEAAEAGARGLGVSYCQVLASAPGDGGSSRFGSVASVPIRGVSAAYGVLAAGAPEPGRFGSESLNFLQSLANTLATAMDRHHAEQRLTYLAQFDMLTGLPNRSLFLDRFSQTLKQALRNGWQVGVLFIDLDRFKIVNDTLGHAVGDKLLVQVALRLQQCVRADDTVGRLGGDEFAFVLANLTRPDDAALIAQKVVRGLSEPFDLEGQEVYVSASLGIAVYPADGSSAETLLKNADTAMYRAKERGRNGYQFYLPQMNEQALERLRLQTQLRGALERGEFVLHYQPKVGLHDGAISGFEALLRWQHPQRGLVPPLEFIGILEDTGLIVPVGEWVVRSVCEQLVRWQAAGLPQRPVAVNLSARQFQQRHFDAGVAAILAETGVDPALIEFELTESMLMGDAEEAVRMLAELKASGVRLSVDDFGTGYSSLAYLKRLPLDALKIDRAFIRDVTIDPDDASITLAIIGLAHSLELTVVAEGVETAEQLAFLKANGCDEMQGFYFAKPLPAPDCTRWLAEGRRLSSGA
jgi:diguanylate cyclase (GGDEF)-like protein/PAS domain S-box-containing protein